MKNIPLTREKEELLEAYVDGKLNPEEKVKVEGMLRNSPGFQDYLAFLKKVKGMSQMSAMKPAPLDLTVKIMTCLSTVRATSTLLPASFAVRWAPLFVTACFFLAFGLFLGKSRLQSGTVSIRFFLDAPRAQTVALAGDFTDWKPVSLKPSGEEWELTLDVPHGRHEYVFILNGRRFVIDPRAQDVVEDSKGDFYSILDTKKTDKKINI